MKGNKECRLTGSFFFNYSKCPRRVYLDCHVPGRKKEASVFSHMLWEQGALAEKRILELISRDRTVGDASGMKEKDAGEFTRQWMAKGVPLIFQGVLADATHVGRPDILERVEGESLLGSYHYIPCDIKAGSMGRRKRSQLKGYQINQILFYAELLAQVQGRLPDSGKIIDEEGNGLSVEVQSHRKKYWEDRERVLKILCGEWIPEPVIGRICKDCVWVDECLCWAREHQDPTLIFKLTAQKFELRSLGIVTLRDLADISAGRIRELTEEMPAVKAKTIEGWKRRAACWVSGRPILHRIPKFRRARREIFYDLEDDPWTDHAYLHGWIEIDAAGKQVYRALFSPDPAEEEKTAQSLWEFLDSLSPEDAIYHYGAYEKVKLNRLREKYGFPFGPLRKFEKIRTDLYRVVEETSDWPTPFYGVKNIAACLGFRWSSEGACGANSIAWFREYREKGTCDDRLRERILTYNREDCEAMAVIKNFLSTASANISGETR